jgi:hypothetical protein
MDGTLIASAGSNLHVDSLDGSSDLHFGHRLNDAESWRGEIAYVAYIDGNLTEQQMQNFLYDWYGSLWQGTGVQYAFPFGISDPEPDFSGNGLLGFRGGDTDSFPVPGPNPPIGPLWRSEGPIEPAVSASVPSIDLWETCFPTPVQGEPNAIGI